MSIKFYSNDLPAARAYAANKLSSYGYEDEAAAVLRDSGFHPDTNRLARSFMSNVAAKLAALRVLVAVTKASAHQIPSSGGNS